MNPVKRRLPILRQVALHSFTLYQNNRNAAVDIPAGVFCLAGANGLGKSSFMTAINFGLTGTVVNPDRAFRGVSDFYKKSATYSGGYFDGRIAQRDRDTASISLTFVVGDNVYQIKRSLFAPRALEALHIATTDGIVIFDGDSSVDDEAKHDAYALHLVNDCRLSNFAQFVFLQHFMLLFDERRHLIFWDREVTDPALYLAFGLDADDAEKADRLRLDVEKAESNARNAQWQATQAKNRLRDLVGESTSVDPDILDDLVDTHQALAGEFESSQELVAERRTARDDELLRLAEVSSRHESIRRDYDEQFSQRFTEQSDPSLSPSVQESIHAHQCTVCGSTDPAAIALIAASVERHKCPMCSTLVQPTTSKAFSRLRDLDEKLAQARRDLDDRKNAVDRLTQSLSVAENQAASAQDRLAAFESEHDSELPFIKSAVGAIRGQRDAIEEERKSAIKRRDSFREARDRYRRELEPLQRALADAYHVAETEFVPLFRSLARQFIGRELDVFLERKGGTGFALTLEVEGERRRATTELSESQRFFLDIALRMALASNMSDPTSPATLFIDTPEGALDIAYEARAGSMFSRFVSDGYNIIMTANINANQLLLRLAERCGSQNMKMVRMTDWAPLSDVQAEEEDLFDEAYARIEDKLSGARA